MKMTKEMAERLNKEIELALEETQNPESPLWDKDIVGVRFENVKREIGDVCNNSKHNPNREDERDFPDFGDEEYDQLPELDGSSAWEAYFFLRNDKFKEGQSFETDHCYIVIGSVDNYHDDCDDGEVVIEEAEVYKILF